MVSSGYFRSLNDLFTYSWREHFPPNVATRSQIDRNVKSRAGCFEHAGPCHGRIDASLIKRTMDFYFEATLARGKINPHVADINELVLLGMRCP